MGTASVAKRVVVAAAVVIALGVGGVLAVRFWPSKHGDAQAPVVAAISDKSIAVLPFTDMSEKKDQEYFADGMAEEVLDLLAKVPGFESLGERRHFNSRAKAETSGRSAKHLARSMLSRAVFKSLAIDCG